MSDVAEGEESKVHHAGAGRYIACWLALAVLTAATFSLSSVDLGAWALPVALIIAVTKSTIVALFFMHLWDQRGANRLVFVVSVLFVLVLMSLTLVDVTTRFSYALPTH
jgi:cytochrome c oxidase subunit 4